MASMFSESAVNYGLDLLAVFALQNSYPRQFEPLLSTDSKIER
jgi:hypothetical protein